mgnify:CR=1 FL=1
MKSVDNHVFVESLRSEAGVRLLPKEDSDYEKLIAYAERCSLVYEVPPAHTQKALPERYWTIVFRASDDSDVSPEALWELDAMDNWIWVNAPVGPCPRCKGVE